MRTTISNVAIKSVAVAIPSDKRDVSDFAKIIGEKEAHRISKNTGVLSLRVSKDGQTSADLCEAAAKKILGDVDKESIVGLVLVTQTPDYIMPATSCVLQHKLGLPNDIVCYDVNAGCTGFVLGLHLASMIASSMKGNVLLLTGDTMTKHVSRDDRSLYLLLGDAGSAALVSHSEGRGISFNIQTLGDGYRSLIIPAGGGRLPSSPKTSVVSERENNNKRSDEHVFMDGMGMMIFALSKVVPQMKDDLALLQDTPDTYLIHQVNKIIVNLIAKNLKLDMNKVPLALENYGNTGPCTIPLDICHCFSNARTLGKSFMATFGVGLSITTAFADLSDIKIYPIEEV